MSDRFTSAIIVAAGNSTRMGTGVNKQLIPLNGKPAIEYTIRAFQNCGLIDEIIVVARPQDIEDIAYTAFAYRKVSAVVAGGRDRCESVRKGIHAATRQATHYAIHDGARPLVTQDEICRVLEKAYETGAAALGTPVIDTIKVVSEDMRILSTPDRASLYAVQTPQVFERSLLQRMMEYASGMNHCVTDDCAVLELLGEAVTVVRGEYTNIKLTTPADIPIAEAILSRRKTS